MLEHLRSGELYPVSFKPLRPIDIEEQLHDWNENLNWSLYFGFSNVEVYKMVIRGDDVIQGAIALERKEDHVWIHLIESIPNERKELDLIGEHLIAFACKRSKDFGHDGAIGFRSKTKKRLMEYYIHEVGAEHIGNGLMLIDESVAEHLIMLYLSKR